MTISELNKEFNTNIEDATEIEMMLEPIIKDGEIIGVVQKMYCPNCDSWEIIQIFTACLDDELEDLVHENGYRDLEC